MLNVNQIIQIYLSCASIGYLAEQFNVSSRTILNIKHKRTHKKLLDKIDIPCGKPINNKHLLDDETVKAIYEFSGTIQDLKNAFGVSPSVAKNIKNHRTYIGVTDGLTNPGEIISYGLAWSDILSIRKASGTLNEIAKTYGISKTTVWNIKNRVTRTYPY